MFFRRKQRFLELPGIHRTRPNIARFAGPYHVVQGFHRLFDGGAVIPAMNDIEVDVVHPQPGQTLVDFAQNRLA